jgi:3-hydroxybutyryl-CoA dehydratase
MNAPAAAATEAEPRRLAPAARVAFRFTVTHDDMAAFAAVSGDRNPIHSDAAYAIERGFRDAVVYGGLLLAKISRLIGMELPTQDCVWTGVKLDFRQPLYVGEEAQLSGEIVHVSDAVRSATVRLRIRAGDRLIATGSAEVSYGAG